ncbi:MAG: hypothetical protein JW881_08070 [Spirochaetales bacterium]|nr:hypothetical protein [Spirochaetales bacterium]
MKISNLILLVAILALHLSCTEGLYDQFGKPVDDPVIVKPFVSSFVDEETIIITWDDDPAADNYILYRSEEVPSENYHVVYRGKKNSYLDRNFIEYLSNENALFHYSLSKVRGTREFGPSEPSLGIFSKMINDPFEPNNDETQAHELSTAKIEGNIYFFRDEEQNLLIDEDWFFITLQPRQQAELVLTQKGDTKLQYFQYQVLNSSNNPTDISHNVRFFVANNSDYLTKIYFKIIPLIKNYMVSGIQTNGGSQRGYYLKITGLWDSI